MKVKFKKLNPDAVIPNSAIGAGVKLKAISKSVDVNGNAVYGTGLAVEIPAGYIGLIFPDAGVSSKTLALSDSVHIVLNGDHSEVTLKFKSTSNLVDDPVSGIGLTLGGDILTYSVGDEIGILLIIPALDFEIEES